MNDVTGTKPLGRKAYGSIGHLPNSRTGPCDHTVHEGQALICTANTRDKHDRIIVSEKLDGTCTAVAKIDGRIYALGRRGYLASSSQYEMHHLFADWVATREGRFQELLHEGERIVGEWLAQAHGTKYRLGEHQPWAVFDLMVGSTRAPYDELSWRASQCGLEMPFRLHDGGAISLATVIGALQFCHLPCDEPEGVVYRVERKGAVDFLAKWVSPCKIDGLYLPEVSGHDHVWNWRPA